MQKVSKIKKTLLSKSFFRFWKYQFLIKSYNKKVKPYKINREILNIGDVVFFEVDNSGLTALAKLTLDKQADWLSLNIGYQVLIEGHADEQGTRDYNLALGARRAQIVKEYLISRGVDPSNISIVTYGKERPIENCSAEVCWSQNRRAVTIVNALSKG